MIFFIQYLFAKLGWIIILSNISITLTLGIHEAVVANSLTSVHILYSFLAFLAGFITLLILGSVFQCCNDIVENEYESVMSGETKEHLWLKDWF